MSITSIERLVRDTLNDDSEGGERRYDVPAIADAILTEHGHSEVSDEDFWLIAEQHSIADEPVAVLAANLRGIGLDPDLFLLTGLAAHVYERGRDGATDVPLVTGFGSGFLEMACTDSELAEISRGYLR